MKYLLLIYDDQEAWGEFDEQTRAGIYKEYGKFYSTMEEKGVMRGGEELQPTTTATTVRMKDGKTLTMDGPYAETKEQLGGYFLVECDNLDEAIDAAAKIPSVKRAASSRSGRSWRTNRTSSAKELVERVFRQESGRAVAALARALGDLDLAEEAVQEAFAIALERWAWTARRTTRVRGSP